MSLINRWADAGEGVVIAGGAAARTYRVDSDGGYYEVFKEETYTKTTKWYALTKEACEEAIALNAQPEDELANNAWSYAIENLNIRAYTLECVFTRNETSMISNSELPAPELSPRGYQTEGNMEMPHSVEITTVVPGAIIKYRVQKWTGGADGSWKPSTLQSAASGDTSVEVQVDSDNTYEDPFYRLVHVSAYVEKTINGVVVRSGTTGEHYRDSVFTGTVSFSPNGGSGFGITTPFTVNLTWADEEAHAEFRYHTQTPPFTSVWIGPGGESESPWTNGFVLNVGRPLRIEARLRKAKNGVTYYTPSVFSNWFYP